MLNHRVIPCLLLRNGGLVKTRKFKNGVYVGDPINAIRIFNEKEVDELVLLDIHASLDKREPDYNLISEIASECFMPLAYGGGVTSMEQIHRLLRLGVEKVILNTALHRDPAFVREAVVTFGSQAITASIDVRRKLFGRREVMTLAGSQPTGKEPVQTARHAESLGVGEILLTSIDDEGSMDGYDIDLLTKVSQAVNVPVIASGGAGTLDHFRAAVREGHASAVSAGSMFVFYGPHRAVLISYPTYRTLCDLFL
jgi:cyclase